MNMRIDLDKIQVASPCNARWDDMDGDERARLCRQCRKSVYNLSAMTRVEIETLIREREGKFCGRFYRREDGRMLTADCPSGQRRRRDRLARWGGAMFGGLLLLLGFRSLAGAQEKGRPDAPKAQPCRLMGEVSISTALMGDIAVAQPIQTKTVSRLRNRPAKNPAPVIMGKIALPQSTNQTFKPAAPKQ